VSDNSLHEFSNDRPLIDIADDKLNRATFAKRIANVLRTLPNGTGLVIGIHGPWGDGKTTVLNLLRSDLEADSKMAVVEFNPWRFTDESAMLAGFFRMLASIIRAKLTTKGEDIAGWVERIGRYGAVVSDRIEKAAEVAGSKAEASLEELRERLSNALAKSDQRIVVLVDDIDRLDKHETHTLFRLIKACADFPNVCYILAFDDVAVSKSLGERYGMGDEASGRAFLEKIIQVPLKLPVAMKEDLRSLCFDRVNDALMAAGVELSREEAGEFVTGFDGGISIRLDTPRSAKRFGNALMFALPMLKGEVNMADLLLMESIRAFYPLVYDCIRGNQGDFVGVDPEYNRRNAHGSHGIAALKSIIERMPSEEQDAVKRVLKELFPRLGPNFGGSNYGSDWLSIWSKDKRICSPDYCSRYFSYAVPRTDVRDSEIDAIISMALVDKRVELSNSLELCFTKGKAKRVIERLRQRETEISPAAIHSLCVAIAALAKHLPNPPALFDFGETPAQAAILISHLIRLLPQGHQRLEAASSVISAADPLWFGAECIRWFHVTEEDDKAEHNTLTKDEVHAIGELLVERIKARSNEGAPLFDVDTRQEQSLLFEWWRIEGRDPVEAHLRAVFGRDRNTIAMFLQSMAPRAWGDGDVFPFVGELDGRQLKNIELVFDLEQLAALIREHFPVESANPQRHPPRGTPIDQRLVGQFMFSYKMWNKDGEPPDPKGAEKADDIIDSEEE
jgi:ABC-type hemin transport system ATPase subunit